MSWNKIFIAIIAVLLISCAKDILKYSYDSYYNDDEKLSYVKALYEESIGKNSEAIKNYYNLYKKYDDEYYFNQAVILGMKTQDNLTAYMLSKHQENEISLIIDAKLNPNDKQNSYFKLKKALMKYKKEFYLYELLSLCNLEKNSFLQNQAITKACLDDKNIFFDFKNYKDEKPIFYDIEYQDYSYPVLLSELLKFDKLYNNNNAKNSLLKTMQLDKLDCKQNAKKCLKTLDILANEKRYDIFFDLASKTKRSISYDIKSFADVMEFNAFYFKLLQSDKKLADRFLDEFYFAYKNDKKNIQILKNPSQNAKITDINTYNIFYVISIQKALAGVDDGFVPSDFYVKDFAYDDIWFYLFISTNDIINKKSDLFYSHLNPKQDLALFSARKSLMYFSLRKCKEALSELDGIKTKPYFKKEYKFILGDYSFDITQYEEILQSCIKELN